LDKARYFIALLTVVTLPPALLIWFVIHPFARSWRKLGPVWTYVLLIPPIAGCMAGLYAVRSRLLAIDYGTSVPLIVLAVLCLAGAGSISRKRRRHLNFKILAGIPELSSGGPSGKLLTEGIYARIRHPRYAEVILWTLGYAFFANYLAPYVAVILSLPVIYLIVLLEERELRIRFGREHEEYCRRVPRFFPGRGQKEEV